MSLRSSFSPITDSPRRLAVAFGRRPLLIGACCAVLSAGCTNREVRVEMRVGADGPQRVFETNRVDGEELSRIAAAYDSGPSQREGGLEGVRFQGEFADEGLPSDVGSSCALVVCERFRDPNLYEHLVYMLEPGGVLVITVLSQVGLDGEAGPHHAPPGELVDAFREYDVVIERHVELDGEATLVARAR